MDLRSTFSFGKYQGRMIENVWTGRIDAVSEIEIISTYLKELFHILLNHSEKQEAEVFTTLDIGACWETISKVKAMNPSFNILITDKYLVLESYKQKLPELKTIIDIALTESFHLINSNFELGKKFIAWNKFTNASKKFMCLQSDPSYIKFCLENIVNFQLSSSQIDYLNNTPSRRLDKFKLIDIEDGLIKFSPVFVEYQCKV